MKYVYKLAVIALSVGTYLALGGHIADLVQPIQAVFIATASFLIKAANKRKIKTTEAIMSAGNAWLVLGGALVAVRVGYHDRPFDLLPFAIMSWLVGYLYAYVARILCE